MTTQPESVTGPRITVLVTEDHPITRFGIVTIINAQPNFSVCAEAGSSREAVTQYRLHKPGIVLMDLRLPDGHGVDAIRNIRKLDPTARIIVLTTYEGDEDIHQSLEAGAMGYLIKGTPYEGLLQAIYRVHAGDKFLPPPVRRTLNARTIEQLSAREVEVLRLMVAGKTNREIGEHLSIKESTVKGHVTVILSRLQVTDRTQAVVTALRRGLEHL